VNHYRLAKFYEECMTIRFLTSLIQVPKLSSEPPNFMANGPPKQMPRNEAKRNNADLDREREAQVLFFYSAHAATSRRARTAKIS
jgi:huntingtin-interacting protein 1-related protein